MNIFIVSINHHPLQLVEVETDNAQHAAHKRALRELLQAHLREQKIAVIFEEQSPVKITIARELASQNDPPIPWHSINMTDVERQAAGILDALKNRPERHVWEDGSMPILVQDRIPADAIRESFFVKQILEGNSSYGEVLVLLGNMHVMPVTEQLRAMGHTVDLRDQLVLAARWRCAHKAA